MARDTRTRERLVEVLQAAREFVADPEWTTTAKLWQREVVAKIDAALASEASADAAKLVEALERVKRIAETEADPETAVVLMLAAVVAALGEEA